MWCSYKSDELVNQVLRERYLDAYPVLGRFASKSLAMLTAGTELDADSIGRYLRQEQVRGIGPFDRKT